MELQAIWDLLASPVDAVGKPDILATDKMSRAEDKTEAAPPLVAIEDLSVRFPPPRLAAGGPRGPLRAVEDVTFSVGEGEAIGLVGESGCGKTTIARVLLGLQRPSAGRVLLRGEPVDFRNPRPLRRAAQMVFQDPASSLNPRLKVWTQVSEPLRGHLGLRSRARRRSAADELLTAVGLRPEDGDLYPHQFSGGQRQRIALARALAIGPALLVADEPVASLDVAAQAEISELLRRLHRQRGLALLLISHDLAGVGAMTGRLMVLYLGRAVEEGPTREVLGNPAHPYTCALLDAAPQLERAKESGSERVVLPGDPPSPYDPPSGCVFRTRCPRAFDRCSYEVPAQLEAASGHRAACFLLDSEQPGGREP